MADVLDTAERFAADTTEHVFHVLRDDGLYRHLRCQRPDSGMYWWEVLTWPDVLVIHGDMGTFVFTRLTDMFEFFRGQRINPLYWSEKVIAGQDQILAYSEELFRQRVEEYVDYWAEDLTEILDSGDTGYPEGAQMLLADFSHVVGIGEETWSAVCACGAGVSGVSKTDADAWAAEHDESLVDPNGHEAYIDVVKDVAEGREFQFHDTWEWDLREYTHHFLWCLHAILWTIDRYDDAKRRADG